jgi:hypothetical protein
MDKSLDKVGMVRLSPHGAHYHPQSIQSHPHNLPPYSDRATRRNQNWIESRPVPVGGTPVGAGPSPGAVATNGVVRDLHRYARVVDSLAALSPGLSVQVLAESIGLRNFLLLRNAGANDVFIGFSSTASANSPLLLTPNQSALFDTVVPQNDIYAFSTGGSSLAVSFSAYSGA